jgi:hypothetical protein
MKVARVTVKAMSHGLWRGRHAAMSNDESAVMAAVARNHLCLLVWKIYYIHACMYLVKRRNVWGFVLVTPEAPQMNPDEHR